MAKWNETEAEEVNDAETMLQRIVEKLSKSVQAKNLKQRWSQQITYAWRVLIPHPDSCEIKPPYAHLKKV